MNQDITVQELKNRLDSGEDIRIIDVREQWEYEEININGELVPLGELVHSLGEMEQWKETEMVIHCRSGQRSLAACDFLRRNGFKNVRNLIGGMNAWEELTNSLSNT